MKLPSKVNVLSSIYKIKIEPDEFINGNGTVCRGSINFHKRLIQIAKDEDDRCVGNHRMLTCAAKPDLGSANKKFSTIT